MSFRDSYGASAAPLASAASLAGSFIRYAFFLFGAIVLALVGFGLLWTWNGRIKVVDDKPAFRITDGSVGRLAVSSDIITGGRNGRIEVMQYGKLHNRETDLTVVMVFPPQGVARTQLGMDLRDTNLLRNVRAQTMATHYDLETRFGPVHAVEMRIETDGRWKQCLSYSTRFNTTAVFMTGWSCDATGSGPGATALACALDKLVIDKPLASAEADAYLRERMARPANCSSSPVTQTFDTRSRGVSPPSRWSQPSSKIRL